MVSRVLTVCMLWVYCATNGQTNDKYEPVLKSRHIVSQWEVLAGVGFNNPILSQSSRKLRKTKHGLFLSVGAIHFFSGRFAMNLKGVYEVKGLRLQSQLLDTVEYNPPAEKKFTQEISLAYAEIMLLPRYYPFKNVHVFFAAGPYIAYLISEKVKAEEFTNGVLTFHGFSKIPANMHNYRDFDIGVCGNIGYALRLSRRVNATIQALYSIGLDNTNRSSAGSLSNSALEISVGLSAGRRIVTR